MSVSVLIRNRPPVIGEIELDAALTESHDYMSRVTQYPVEDGSTMSDHIQNQPVKLSIEGFVTNNPIRTTAAAGASPTVDAARNAGVGTRAIGAFNALMALRDAREPVTIVTNLKSYPTMALESLNVPKNARTGDALRFTSVWVEIRKVTSETVFTEDLAVSDSGAKAGISDQASSQRDAGKQNTPETAPANRSWLASIAGSFGG